jgi:hypothetical protein
VVSKSRFVGVCVYVPSLDGVVMIDAKSSVVDIIQTVARPLTIDPNNPNKIATILIPVFVDDEMEVEEMIEASSFKNMVNVINAMKSVDETLIDAVNDFSTSDGSAKSLNAFSQGRIKFDIKLPEKLSTEEIMSGVRLQVLRSTQNNTESMITRVLTELVPFVKKEGKMPTSENASIMLLSLFSRKNAHIASIYQALDGLNGWDWAIVERKRAVKTSVDKHLTLMEKAQVVFTFIESEKRCPSNGKDGRRIGRMYDQLRKESKNNAKVREFMERSKHWSAEKLPTWSESRKRNWVPTEEIHTLKWKCQCCDYTAIKMSVAMHMKRHHPEVKFDGSLLSKAVE